MEIKLKINDGSKKELTLVEPDYNVLGWIKLEIDGEEIGDILLADLMPAAIAFDAKFSRAKED